MRHLTRSLLLAAAVSPLYATNYGSPLLDATAPTFSSNVSFGGQSYVNKGLVGVGVFATNVIDGRGDTFGTRPITSGRRSSPSPCSAPSA